MSMKDAFDNYFYKLNRYLNGKQPITVYDKECDIRDGIYIPNTLDECGYVQWHPVLQTQLIDYSKLENELGFVIHKSIKEFHSIYWFDCIECLLNGGQNMWINGVLPYNGNSPEAVLKKVRNGFNNCMADLLIDTIYYEIGGVDSNGIYVDNRTGKVIIANIYEELKIELANSIESLLNIFAGENV